MVILFNMQVISKIYLQQIANNAYTHIASPKIVLKYFL